MPKEPSLCFLTLMRMGNLLLHPSQLHKRMAEVKLRALAGTKGQRHEHLGRALSAGTHQHPHRRLGDANPHPL